jgi:hypothetical protein
MAILVCRWPAHGKDAELVDPMNRFVICLEFFWARSPAAGRGPVNPHSSNRSLESNLAADERLNIIE